MTYIDQWLTAALAPLGVWILLSGLDDLVPVAACFIRWLRCRLGRARETALPSDALLRELPEKPVAIFVPLWIEHEVIGRMLEHNLAAIRYGNFHFFVGAYPNDDATLAVVHEFESRFPNVHVAVCPHDGPTSKADCLNWIYQHMLLHEESSGMSFEVVVTHDAEDLIHPEALRWINYYTETSDMVQVPVLPLPTPLRRLTHGLYCDEFAEYQTKDMPARQIMGAFLPSNGVGTGYARRALERLASAASNRVFEPACLTEDYENGLRLNRLGCRQFFVPIRFLDGRPVATREYFPQTFGDSIKQRTRWVTGISLQSWERHGWSGNLRQRYWFWRDRKGLIGSPVTILTNAIFIYGLATLAWSAATGVVWGIGRAAQYPFTRWLLITTLGLQIFFLGIRAGCAGRVYGWRFALGVPVRVVWGNWINFVATVSALFRYARAKLRHEPLLWVKTEHAYPSRSTLVQHKRGLREILVNSLYVSEDDVIAALAAKPSEVRLGDYLVQIGKLSEDELYEALSLQQSVPLGKLEPGQVSRQAAHALPAHVVHRWKVLPYRILAGDLFLAGPEWPVDQTQKDLRRFTRLGIRFQLITPMNFSRLEQRFVGVHRPSQ